VKTILGRLTELVYRDLRNVECERTWPLTKAPALVYDARGRLSLVYPENVLREASAKEQREYLRTHWGQPGEDVVCEGTEAGPPLERIGSVLVVVYTVKKGTGGLTDWEHEFEGTRPSLVEHRCRARKCDGRGKLALRGGTYRVKREGIVG
jgi:hypothetical protein